MVFMVLLLPQSIVICLVLMLTSYDAFRCSPAVKYSCFASMS